MGENMTMITAALVKELRERTGVGMMECKKALTEASGDLDLAIDNLRKAGQLKAAKKSGRVAAEGMLACAISSDLHEAVMVEVNCETDFASRNADFIAFADYVAKVALAERVSSVDELYQVIVDGRTINEAKDNLIAKIGENIGIRRVAYCKDGAASFFSYVHGNSKIGALVALKGGNSELGRDLAMHIVAMKPLALDERSLPADLVAKEREIALAQLSGMNKPQAVLDKIVAGKLSKFASENSLLGQSFIKNSELTIAELLKQQRATIESFIRYEVGEGVVREVKDFASEVEELAKH